MAMHFLVDVRDSLVRGWRTLATQPWPLVGGFFTAALLSLTLLLAGPMAVAYARLCLRAARGEQVRYAEVFDIEARFWPNLLLGLALLLITKVGFVFGPVLGGIISLVAIYAVLWSAWLAADGEDDPLVAIACSVRLSTLYWRPAVMVYAILWLACAALGPLAFVLGPLVATVITGAYLEVMRPSAGSL